MLERLWKKTVNRETVSYLIFGVLTTLVDWISYWLMRQGEMDYKLATVLSWAAAVLFAFVTNKLFVFNSRSLEPKKVWNEFVSFVLCRAATGAFTVVAMIAMVDGLGIRQDFICKVVVSAISLVMNYGFSKLFIFKKEADGADDQP
ncbi:MAG TPA: GtrA family protein [Candidatus Ventrimonas merdavium]|nr:GtrA family protein [Candidatus Ventrimonas merdavium]